MNKRIPILPAILYYFYFQFLFSFYVTRMFFPKNHKSPYRFHEEMLVVQGELEVFGMVLRGRECQGRITTKTQQNPSSRCGGCQQFTVIGEAKVDHHETVHAQTLKRWMCGLNNKRKIMNKKSTNLYFIRFLLIQFQLI